MRPTHLQWGRSTRALRFGAMASLALSVIALLLAMPGLDHDPDQPTAKPDQLSQHGLPTPSAEPPDRSGDQGSMPPPVPAQSGQCSPLVMEGKRTLFQRVLTRPEAVALNGPGGSHRQDLFAFSRLYIYERISHEGREWLRLGTDERCQTIVGWVDEEQTVPWRHQLSLALTNPAGRERLLFFRSDKDLKSVLNSADPATWAQQTAATLDAGGLVPGVSAVEPSNFIDLHKHFYLLPILDIEKITTGSGREVRALKVAAVTRTSDRTRNTGATPTQAETVKDFRAAIVFVIDSTLSMKDHIDETREAIEHFYERIERAQLLDKVAFGLVGFRAEVRDDPTRERLGYVARVFASPTEVDNGRAFMARIADLEEATASTDFFDEDAYAGIDAALHIPKWTDEFNARFLVLVTDAGALDGNPANRDPGALPGQPGRQSSTREDAATLQSRAANQGVAIAVMHLLTPRARDAGNIPRASEQYRELASNSNTAFNRAAYFPIADGSVEAFRGAVDDFANALIDLMEQAKLGHVGAPTRPNSSDGNRHQIPPNDPGQTAKLIGHAMLLAYLGERQQTTAPAESFDSWIIDTDLRDPGIRTALPHVLMTRDQLSNLREIVLKVIDIAEPTLGQPDLTKQFYERLASIAAWHERRENNGGNNAADLSKNDLLEYLDDLPYRSEVLELKSGDWARWSTDRQTQFVDRMRKKANLYKLYYESLDCWVDIAQSADAYGRQSVCPVPLRDLP